MTTNHGRGADEMLAFCQQLIRTPSPTGREEALADLIASEMERLGYDEVSRDDAGNVIGTIRATDAALPSILFTAHMDHVSPGDLTRWEHDPYGGERDDTWIHGRGASDTKGAIATQVYLPAALGAGRRHGNLYVAQVVGEEVGGLGSRVLLQHLRPHYAIMGEATGNELRNGNRGRILVRARFEGDSVHASVARRDQIAHYRAAAFLRALSELPTGEGLMGGFTAVPTRGASDLPDDNVTPNAFELSVDCRIVPGERPEDVLSRLEALLPDERSRVWIPPFDLSTYTGRRYRLDYPQPPYWIAPDHPFVLAVRGALSALWGRHVPVQPWGFTTDCGLFTKVGVPILGFSPCEEQYTHTPRDRVSIELMIEAWRAYPAIIDAISSLGIRGSNLSF